MHPCPLLSNFCPNYRLCGQQVGQNNHVVPNVPIPISFVRQKLHKTLPLSTEPIMNIAETVSTPPPSYNVLGLPPPPSHTLGHDYSKYMQLNVFYH